MVHLINILPPLTKLLIGAPKGSIGAPIRELFGTAAIHYVENGEDTEFIVMLDKLEIIVQLMAPQSIPRFLLAQSNNELRVGITGRDCLTESMFERNLTGDSREVIVIDELPINKRTMGNVRIVSARRDDCSPELIEEKTKSGELKILTEYPHITKNFFSNIPKKNITHIIRSAEEEFTSHDEHDLVVCVTETGSGLKKKHLQIHQVIMESSTVLVAMERNPYLVALGRYLKSGIMKPGIGYANRQGTFKHIVMHVRKEFLSDLLEVIPSMLEPTVTYLRERKQYDVQIVIREDYVLPLYLRISECVSGWAEMKVDRVIP